MNMQLFSYSHIYQMSGKVSFDTKTDNGSLATFLTNDIIDRDQMFIDILIVTLVLPTPIGVACLL